MTDLVAPKNKFQAQGANLDESQYGGTIQQAQGAAGDASKFNQVFGQQQDLQGQYGQIAQGKGPNPAKEMLRQQTGQNVNMAQGQAASQRGANPALAARLAVDSGAAMNQQAAGQGATMQAQQQLAALAAQQAGLGQMQQGANTQQAIQTQLLGTAGGLQNQQNNARVANTLGTNQINAGVAAQNTQNSAQMLGGLMNAAGGAMGMPMMAAEGGLVPEAEQPSVAMEYGGLVPSYAQGGPVEEASPLHGYLDSLEALHAPVQRFQAGGMAQPREMPTLGGPGALQAPQVPSYGVPAVPDLQLQPSPLVASAPEAAPEKSPRGGKLSAPFGGMDGGISAFDRFARMPMPHLAAGGPIDFQGGGHVPGQAQVQGDSERNDTVPALLSPGEAVIPRTIMQSDNPPAEAAAFIEHLLRRRGGPSFEKAMGGRKMAGGGEVKDNAPSLTEAVSGWWAARGTPEQEQHGRNVDEALNAILPRAVSGRKALLTKRESLKQADKALADASKE